jgi:hypothetical protein
MRLLNVASLQLEEFFDDHLPTYAILSHTWQEDEVSFQDMQGSSAPNKKGYSKIKRCCYQAVKDGLQYAWVDTCCIDKSSSAELTEAINSMHRWYQNAAVCYAYLFDVGSRETSLDSMFSRSAWWTRGWTLQELIAPSQVEFYSSTWDILGTKQSLKETISTITGIDIEALGGKDLDTFSIAQRMSWASKRFTTRTEDMAYSLLGIFRVNMPMLYGEGQRAFIRLQEEILKQSDDHSLFAWSCPDTSYRGLLAKSPSYFSECSGIRRSASKFSRAPYSVTNMGLRVELFMTPWAMETYLAALDCEVEGTPNRRIGIFLKLLDEQDQAARVMLHGKDVMCFPPEWLSDGFYVEIFVRQQVWGIRPFLDLKYGFSLRSVHSSRPDVPGSDHQVARVHSWNEWNDEERILEIPTGSRGTAGELWYTSAALGDSMLKLGFDTSFNPVCLVTGPLWGPASRPIKERDNKSFHDQMESSWMHRPNPDVHRGFRLKGLCRYMGSAKVSIQKEVIANQIIWVVDIERYYPTLWKPWEGTTCDGCTHPQYVRNLLLPSFHPFFSIDAH